MIKVTRLDRGSDPMTFEVELGGTGHRNRYSVTLSAQDHQRLTAGRHAPESLVCALFHFLLDREPEEQILSRFDVSVVGRYFPEVETDLQRYLGN